MKGPEFLRFTERAKLDVEPSTGEQTAAFPAQAQASPAAAAEAARKLLHEPQGAGSLLPW